MQMLLETRKWDETRYSPTAPIFPHGIYLNSGDRLLTLIEKHGFAAASPFVCEPLVLSFSHQEIRAHTPVSQSAPKEPDDLGLSPARSNCEISHQSLRLL